MVIDDTLYDCIVWEFTLIDLTDLKNTGNFTLILSTFGTIDENNIVNVY